MLRSSSTAFPPENGPQSAASSKQGMGYATFAYVFWGFAPVYFVWAAFATPTEILAHRIVWSVPMLLALVWFAGMFHEFRSLGGAALQRLVVCSILLTINWLTFIYAISESRIAETALGYFINPLISIVLGRFLLGEPMRPLQWVAAGLAATGVLIELAWMGSVPILALILAVSFGFYGLLRKGVAVSSPVGLSVETLVVVPFALGYILFVELNATRLPYGLGQYAYLALGGLVTITPLLAFGAAARRLPLTVIGFFQYIAPSLSLILAIVVYDEAVSTARWVNLSFIWFALLLFTAESLFHYRRSQRMEFPSQTS